MASASHDPHPAASAAKARWTWRRSSGYHYSMLGTGCYGATNMIYYIHGFASRFDPTSEKVTTLKKLGDVYGITVDYADPPEETLAKLTAGVPEDATCILGTSMGGWAASLVAANRMLPFVAINPALNPHESLAKYVGANDFRGNPNTITHETVAEYAKFPFDREGNGLILLDMGDEVIDAAKTAAELKSTYSVKTFEGGNHRFAHMEEALPKIRSHINAAEKLV